MGYIHSTAFIKYSSLVALPAVHAGPTLGPRTSQCGSNLILLYSESQLAAM